MNQNGSIMADALIGIAVMLASTGILVAALGNFSNSAFDESEIIKNMANSENAAGFIDFIYINSGGIFDKNVNGCTILKNSVICGDKKHYAASRFLANDVNMDSTGRIEIAVSEHYG
jgi:hypothetical protein